MSNTNKNEVSTTKSIEIEAKVPVSDTKKIQTTVKANKLEKGNGVKKQAKEETKSKIQIPDVFQNGTELLDTETNKNDSTPRRQSVDAPRRQSFALSRIKLANTSVRNVVDDCTGFPKYAVNGIRVVESIALKDKNIDKITFEGGFKSYEKTFKHLLNLNIFLQSDGTVKLPDSAENKRDSLKAICRTIADEDITVTDRMMKFFLNAGQQGENLLRRHLINDKIELQKSLAENKFIFTGEVDYFCSGKDRLENKQQHIVLFRCSTEKFILSRDTLELFLYAATMDLPTVYLLTLHLKDASIALYEFKFKFDKLRDYNKSTTVKNICENFFKNAYCHPDYRIIFRPS